MDYYEFVDSKIGDKIYLRTDVRELKIGYYSIIDKDYFGSIGCEILVEGTTEYLHCNFFHTINHMRKLKIKSLLNFLNHE